MCCKIEVSYINDKDQHKEIVIQSEKKFSVLYGTGPIITFALKKIKDNVKELKDIKV